MLLGLHLNIPSSPPYPSLPLASTEFLPLLLITLKRCGPAAKLTRNKNRKVAANTANVFRNRILTVIVQYVI